MDGRTPRWSAQDIEHARERLEIMEGIEAALGRWSEVAVLAFGCDAPESLVDALCELLDIGRVPARAVTEMQVRRVTREQRARIAEEVEELRARLDEATEQGRS